MPDSSWFRVSYGQGPLRKGHALGEDKGWVGGAQGTLVV